jgi:carboxylesterase type B
MKMKVFISLLLNSILLINYFKNSQATECDKTSDIILESKSGRLRGKCSFIKINDEDDSKSDAVYSWLSVPYSKPPIKERRFERGEPITWTGILDATKIPNSCGQFIDKTIDDKDIFRFEKRWGLSKDSKSRINEDCLYLNIWAPNKAFESMKEKKNSDLPIMVFFHGGELVGSSILDIYNPTRFVAMTDTIVITVNYRIGVFGFFHLIDGNKTLQGNQGLFDQHLALKWINENAEKFGGDSSKVTLVGHGSGAELIGYHLLYKPSWPLFRNLIFQSGKYSLF